MLRITRLSKIVPCLALVSLPLASAIAAPPPELRTKIAEYLGGWHEVGRFNGAALVARDGEVLFSGGFGPANREWDIPNTPETKFRIGSISKQFTTVLVLQLVVEGRLKLDDRLSEHLPDFRRDIAERVTIDQLLRHTSGMPCYVRDSKPEPDGRGAFRFDMPYEREELISRFMCADLLFEPGSQYHYSSTGGYLLAMIVEKLTGKSFAENLRTRICEPLGMHNTGVDMPGHLLEQRAAGYVKVAGGYANAINEYIPNVIGAGGLYSTVGDLYIWNRAFRTGNMLPEEWRKKMLEVYWPGGGESHAYSITYFTIRTPAGVVRYSGFSGGMPGFMTDAFHFPDCDLTVVLFDNSTQYEHWMIAPAIHGIVNGQSPRPPLPHASVVLGRAVVEQGVDAAAALRGKLESESRGAYDWRGLEGELNTLGYNTLASHMPKTAIDVFELNVKLFPGSWNVYDSLAEAYRKTGQDELSKKFYAKAEEIKHREDRLLDLIRAGEFEQATARITEIRTNDPDGALFTPSRIGPLFGQAMQAGDNERALAITKVWILGNPKTVGPYFSQTRVYERLGRTDEMIACYRRILEISPEGPHVKQVREALARLGADDKQ